MVKSAWGGRRGTKLSRLESQVRPDLTPQTGASCWHMNSGLRCLTDLAATPRLQPCRPQAWLCHLEDVTSFPSSVTPFSLAPHAVHSLTRENAPRVEAGGETNTNKTTP